MSRKAAKKRRTPQPEGHLLIVACSDRKLAVKGKLPALELYDGVNFRVLRKFFSEHGWPAGLCVKILSAKYGLIDANDLIEFYDQRMDAKKALRCNRKVLQRLADLGGFRSVFINLGKDYLPAIDGIRKQIKASKFVYAKEGIGCKMAEMKEWLHMLPNKTASLTNSNGERSYLYFFPDWDDYVMEPFVHETATDSVKQKKLYAHQIFGAEGTPYDGLLVSLAQIKTGKGALSRLKADEAEPGDLRKQMKIPKRLLLFGDCGAFDVFGRSKVFGNRQRRFCIGLIQWKGLCSTRRGQTARRPETGPLNGLHSARTRLHRGVRDRAGS